MNVNAINRTIDAIRNDKTNKFDMGNAYTCIMGFATRSSENPENDPIDADIILGISWYDASQLFYARGGVGYDATREDAARVLEHLRDTGKVNWHITNRLTGWAYRLYDRVVAR